ncbi:MAG: IS66 family transposase, partial [Chloroflexota bacterium]
MVRASREALIALIVQQREEIAALRRANARQAAEIATMQALVTELTARVGELLAVLALPDGDDPGGRPTTMPGLKPVTGQTPAPSAPRKRRAHGYGRRRMTPTARQVHAYATCPACHTPLRGGTRRRRREVIELIPARVAVTEHVYVERRCPRCHGHWQPGPELDGVVVGQRRFGNALLSLIAFLREELRLPIRAIQGYLAVVAGLHVSVGSIVAAGQTLAARAETVVAGLQETIRAGPVLHVDETGWREDGRNGYAWTFSTERERLFVHGGRDKRVLAETIGEDYAGVLVSDFYAVYTGYAGRHQYCWAHLPRDVDELVAQHRADAGVRGWADRVHALYQ